VAIVFAAGEEQLSVRRANAGAPAVQPSQQQWISDEMGMAIGIERIG
jgi:hypothetical protein